MKKIYQKIKQTARKYALPVLVAGSMALGGTSCQYQETSFNEQTVAKKSVDKLVSVAEKNIFDAKNLFNQKVLEKNIDSTNLFKIYNFYKEAMQRYNQASKIAEKNDLQRVNMPKEDLNNYLMFIKTAKGVDFGRSNIEKQLEKEGIKGVAVYNPSTKTEQDFLEGFALATPPLLFLALGIPFLIGFGGACKRG